jgi:hypothetical protein
MKSTSFARSSHWSSRAAALFIVLGTTTARAGEELTIDEIAAQTEGAAIVTVSVGRSKVPESIELVKVLKSLPADLAPSLSWSNLCVPRAPVLKKWIIQYAKWPARALWRRALARGSYQAVVMVQKRDDGYQPFCGVEAMQMRHTSLHQGFAKYLQEVDETFAKRAGKDTK